METSNISWTDGTWNPWYGCDKVGGPESECANCYIDRFLRRQGRKPWGQLYKSKTWNDPLRIQRQAKELIAQYGRPYRFFTCSLFDFFHRKADEWRPNAWNVISQCPDVDFLVLTKRAHRIAECLPPDWGSGWPNVWLGVSVGRMSAAHRIDKLRQIPACIRFISAEPLLESLAELNLDGIHWLIAGGGIGRALSFYGRTLGGGTTAEMRSRRRYVLLQARVRLQIWNAQRPAWKKVSQLA